MSAGIGSKPKRNLNEENWDAAVLMARSSLQAA